MTGSCEMTPFMTVGIWTLATFEKCGEQILQQKRMSSDQGYIGD